MCEVCFCLITSHMDWLQGRTRLGYASARLLNPLVLGDYLQNSIKYKPCVNFATS